MLNTNMPMKEKAETIFNQCTVKYLLVKKRILLGYIPQAKSLHHKLIAIYPLSP